MKRFISLTLAVVMLSLSLFALASCGGMSGTYVSETGYLTYEFTARKLIKSDEYTEFDTVYTYEVQKNGSNRYILLTLEGYEYDGDDASVAAYVAAQNAALEGKTQEPQRLYYTEKADGTIKIGALTFVKQD